MDIVLFANCEKSSTLSPPSRPSATWMDDAAAELPTRLSLALQPRVHVSRIFDVLTAVASLADQITDVLVLIQFSNDGLTGFFTASLCALVLAQLGFALLFTLLAPRRSWARPQPAPRAAAARPTPAWNWKKCWIPPRGYLKIAQTSGGLSALGSSVATIRNNALGADSFPVHVPQLATQLARWRLQLQSCGESPPGAP